MTPMSNLLQQLENNEAVLLMYLAGELPECDRVEVEQQLVNDPGLRAAMAELVALDAEVNAALASTADAPAGAARREASIRRVVRAMAAATDRTPALALSGADPGQRFRLAWWAYPVAAAAVLLVGILVMTNRTPSKLEPSPEAVRIASLDMMAPTPRILEQTEDPALERLDQVEKQVLSLHTHEAGLFDVDSLDTDR
jgi:anti-sigma factor RsiW